ncbi:hypothetical protein HY025_02905 [Candidatus Daviesbacteria bacterium]|nr:hypothetical protein [Candidatus Daviesbacteria bacterium]
MLLAKKFFRQKLLSVGLVIILILAIAFLLIFQNQSWVKEKLVQKSTADIFIQGNHLKINFKVKDSGQAKLNSLINNLGVSNDFLNGISLELDSASLAKLSKSLPTQVKLQINDKQISFQGSNTSLLSTGLPNQSFHFASASSSINLKFVSDENYDLEIIDPEPLAVFATSSGTLHLSNKLQGLFPILSKIAKINLVVNGKSLNGELLLK